MEGSVITLSKYRYQCAQENIEAARILLESKQFKSSVNRSYYAVFHALRALTALDRFDSSKHSGVIAFVNRNYVKKGVFDRNLSKIIDTTFRLREKADYEDFFVVSLQMAEEQLEKAEHLLQITYPYLDKCWKTESDNLDEGASEKHNGNQNE